MSTVDQELAAQEKAASRSFELGGYRVVLIVAIVAYVLALVGPVVPGLPLASAVIHRTGGVALKAPEWLFIYLSLLGALCLAALVLLRRTVWAVSGWLLCGIAMLTSLFALWLRQTNATGVASSGWGMYLAIASMVAAVYVLSATIMRRSAAQRELAEKRQSLEVTDAVGIAQNELLAQQQSDWTGNPLLRDDRRREAARRHHRHDEGQSPNEHG